MLVLVLVRMSVTSAVIGTLLRLEGNNIMANLCA
jgi:hypothetical protein